MGAKYDGASGNKWSMNDERKTVIMADDDVEPLRITAYFCGSCAVRKLTVS